MTSLSADQVGDEDYEDEGGQGGADNDGHQHVVPLHSTLISYTDIKKQTKSENERNIRMHCFSLIESDWPEAAFSRASVNALVPIHYYFWIDLHRGLSTEDAPHKTCDNNNKHFYQS